jgi:phosphoribosylformylglycinamidine synthase II/phosphoribosylformylglycinamidine synthase I
MFAVHFTGLEPDGDGNRLIGELVRTDRIVELRPRISTPAPWLDLPADCPAITARHRVFRIRCDADPRDDQLAILFDPLLESLTTDDGGCYVDVFCKAGVTDAEGDTAALALQYTGIHSSICHSGLRYRFEQLPSQNRRHEIEGRLGNALIHEFTWSDAPRSQAMKPSVPRVQTLRTIPLRDATGEALIAISRVNFLGLDHSEMHAIRAYFAGEHRDPTDVELQSIALAWSEHCSHKTFKSTIEFDGPGGRQIIHGLLKEFIAQPLHELAPTYVKSAFVDNAGIFAFNDRYDLACKVETHNHPSALEPYGGAHTGVGGVIRDVLAVSAEPIANTDVLCFGPLDLPADEVAAGSHHPRRTLRDVVRGIADYGNNMGIPTVGGAVFFDPRFTTNPLVFCGTVGLLPAGSHPRDPQSGDAIVLLGGRTGRDGLHGATMSSESLDRKTVAGTAVQIGAPITEKLLRDLIPRLRDEQLYSAITDCGAGGLCSAIGEMGEELGVDVELADVPVKYTGLTPWEIWLSEAQERMVIAVPPTNLHRARELCRDYGVEATVLGAFRTDRRLKLFHEGHLVADLDLGFMHGGRPNRVLSARWHKPTPIEWQALDETPGEVLLRLLCHPNIASKAPIIRRYDFDVQGRTVGKPLTAGAAHSDGAVLQPLFDSEQGVAVGHGFNPLYGHQDPYDMAMLAVCEALCNVVAAGGSIDGSVLLDNFCWGEVDDPISLGRLVRAAEGCRDAALLFGTPFISGKDSLRNTSVDSTGAVHSIPDALLISAVGPVRDIRRTTSTNLVGDAAGSILLVVGETHDELGGSHLNLVSGCMGGRVPAVAPSAPQILRNLTTAIEEGLVLSCHDIAEGGLVAALSEMCIAGRRGATIDLACVPGSSSSATARAFAESAGRFLVEVSKPAADRVLKLFASSGLPIAAIGSTNADRELVIANGPETFVRLDIDTIEAAWRAPISPDLFDLPTTLAEPATVGRKAGTRLSVMTATALVVAAPGTNCDQETVQALKLAGATVETVRLRQLTAGEFRLEDFDIFVIPGGFAHGDHLGAGAMLASIIDNELRDDLVDFAATGRPILGICNGFQVLARLGLLGPIALAPNVRGLFECRWVPVVTCPTPCPYFDGLESFDLPIAHGEGRIVIQQGCEPDVLARAPLRYSVDVNGSADRIAGVCSENGTVLGLMPHPERFITREQHPSRPDSYPPGRDFFDNVVKQAVRAR